MKTLSRALASLLAVSLASQNALAQFSRAVVRPVPVSAGLPGAAAAGTTRLQAAPSLALPGAVAPAALPGAAFLLPSAVPSASPVAAARAQASAAPAPAAPAAVVSAAPAAAARAAALAPASVVSAQAGAAKPGSVSERLGAMTRAAADSISGLSAAPVAGAREAASAQFSVLTGERAAVRPAASTVEAPVASALGSLAAPRLAPANAADEPAAPEVPAPAKKSWKQVFVDPARNSAFWRYFVGSSVFLVGFQMYMVALPYLIKSFTQNTLRDAGRTVTAEQLTELVRENRSLSRIAHWTAQAVSYVAVPMFSDSEGGPRRWLVRSLLTRAVVLGAVPALFFATGLMTASTAMWTLFALIGVQSFFQGLSVTMESKATTKIFGDKTVTAEERLRANAILSFTSAVIAIIAPAIAGRIAGMPEWLGKSGTGTAVLYGIYAATVGIAGLVYATIKLIGGDTKQDAGGAAAPAADAARPSGLWQSLKNVALSMKEGVKLVLKNRFLRTLLLFNLVVSLFSDPLIFNVLPEFVEGVLKTSPGAMNWALGIPGLGWFLQGLISTPMGFFGLLVAFSSVGSAVVALSIEPMRKLFKKLGFDTEERLTIPFYILSALEAPAFWAMIHFPSFWGVLLLYGLQTLVTGYVGLIVSGLYQKQLGDYSSKQLTQVLAANSFVGIIAAIISTFAYGFVLKGISIETSLLIAGVATTVMAVLHAAAPWLLFNKGQRQKAPAPAPATPEERASLRHDTRQGHEHLPHQNHQPNHVGF